MRRPILAALAILVSLGFLALPIMVPVLQAFLDPVHGVAAAARGATLPSGVLEAPGVPGEARVYWDEYGIPHIYATTDEAGVYAVGWVTASQRLFQMDLLRRIGEGRLAELVGKEGLDNDVFIRTIGLPEALNKTWEEIKSRPELEKLERLLEAYARGVNDYIEYAIENNLLPVEYRVLGQEPEPWKPIDTLAVARVIALGLAWNDEDLVLAKLVDKWGPEIIDLMGLPGWQGTLEQADCAMATTWGEASGARNALDYTRVPAGPSSLAPTSASTPPPTPHILEWIEKVVSPIRAWAGMASNNWVVSGAYTPSGAPLVANDPHLQLTAPPIWFIVEINTPSFKSIGTLFPGTPLVVIGRNQHLAWAFTNVMGDFTDYYYYVWDGDKYYYKGQWLEAEKRTITIRVYDPVKRSYTLVNKTILETIHGPVLERGGERLAVRWTGMDVSFEIQFFVELNNASTVREALAAQRWFHVPIQNFIVADDQGNFAYSPVGGYPVRNNTPVILAEPRYQEGPIVNTGMLPFNGSRGEGEWIGYYPKEELPVLYNPPVPFIVTANSKPWRGPCGVIVGWHYGDKYRQERITMLLGEAVSDGVVTLDEVKRIQFDNRDLSIEDYLETAILPYNDSNWSRLLADWLREEGGAVMDAGDYRPTIAMAWVYAYHERLWSRLYGSLEDMSFLRVHYALNIVRHAAQGDRLALEILGDPATAASEALSEALSRLRAFYQAPVEDWVYGEIHYFQPVHMVFKTLSLPKKPAGGGPYSVNPARPTKFTVDEGMPVNHGASMRHITCLSGNTILLSLPGGESGNPVSPHYGDLYEYWARGEYVLQTLARPEDSFGSPDLVFRGGTG